jgi:hypothetical protein
MKASMISVLNLLCLATAAAFLLSAPVFAQDAQIQAPSNPAQPGNADKVLELQRLIEAQQRQLDAQREQLEAQEKKLQELRQQAQGLAQGAEPPKAPVAEKSKATLSGGVAPRRTDTQTARRDKAHPHDDWKGSFGVEGLDTRFKIGGFVELDVIHDTDAIATPGEFVTSAIVTRDATKAEGSDGLQRQSQPAVFRNPNARKARPADDIFVHGPFWRFNQHWARPAVASGLRGIDQHPLWR